jgi:hypothetical protein
MFFLSIIFLISCKKQITEEIAKEDDIASKVESWLNAQKLIEVVSENATIELNKGKPGFLFNSSGKL